MQILKRIAIAGASLVTTLAVVVSPAAAISQAVVYSNIADPVPGNVISLGYEATATSEFGGQVELAGTERNDPKVTVLMSSWGCESGSWFSNDCVTTPGATFSHPITLNVYEVGADNVPGTLIETNTKTFEIPYRPTAEPGCGDGRWSTDGGSTCFNGLAVPISFELIGTTLPNKVIISVAYNTTHYGHDEIGEEAQCYTDPGGCGYDSLNVGAETDLSAGTQPLPEDAYLNSSSAGSYCDGDLGTGTFRLDAGCWEGYQPSFKVEANAPAIASPTNKDQCKKDGWKAFNNPGFKNQGDCVSFVATKGRN